MISKPGQVEMERNKAQKLRQMRPELYLVLKSWATTLMFWNLNFGQAWAGYGCRKCFDFSRHLQHSSGRPGVLDFSCPLLSRVPRSGSNNEHRCIEWKHKIDSCDHSLVITVSSQSYDLVNRNIFSSWPYLMLQRMTSMLTHNSRHIRFCSIQFP